MEIFQQQFIEFALQQQALKFGEFTLKSGRKSPYFFNAGEFKTGGALAKLGRFYAEAIEHATLQFDMLFGPAYKGIPLACSTAIALGQHFEKDYPYAFNRKEAKDHGEGGQIVGSALQGKVLLIDDVITAGTAFRESMNLFAQTEADICGVVIAIDRQERGLNQTSAIVDIQQEYNIPVISIIAMQDLITYLQGKPSMEQHVANMLAYRETYGV